GSATGFPKSATNPRFCNEVSPMQHPHTRDGLSLYEKDRLMYSLLGRTGDMTWRRKKRKQKKPQRRRKISPPNRQLHPTGHGFPIVPGSANPSGPCWSG